ncbi:MAG TPA: hypothetical protein ENH23_05145 [candidate division Zixibacteria bacterium]|nr:hypothetical protein [candidate division Zixibacteria bacterium]
MSEYETLRGLSNGNVKLTKELDHYIKGLMDGIYITNTYADDKLFCPPDKIKHREQLEKEIASQYYLYSRHNIEISHIAVRSFIARFPCP